MPLRLEFQVSSEAIALKRTLESVISTNIVVLNKGDLLLKVQSLLAVTLLLCSGTVALPANPSGALHLRDVLKSAGEAVDRQDDSVQTARLELQMLEALNRTRVEFRPQLSLLSFSNPLFLAASIGGSFSVNRRTAPSPVNMELARLAVVEAELGHARARVRAQVDATAAFFALAESRQSAERACKTWASRGGDQDKVQTLVSLKRMTKLDSVRFEQDLTDLEGDCIEAKAQVQTAASSLIRLVGEQAASEPVDIALDDLTQFASAAELPAAADLAKAVFESQKQFRLISEHLASLEESAGDHRVHFESFSTGYSYLKNAEKGLGSAGKQYLLGGNVGHVDTTFYISLRKTGDVKATDAFVQARFDRLDHNLEDLKRNVRHELEDNEQRAALASARLRLAQKKQRLADQFETLTGLRVEAGLQLPTDQIWASRDAMRAQTDAARLDFEWKRSVFTVLALFDPEKLDAAPLLALGHVSEPVKSDQASSSPVPVAAPTRQNSPQQAVVYRPGRSLAHAGALVAASTSQLGPQSR